MKCKTNIVIQLKYYNNYLPNNIFLVEKKYCNFYFSNFLRSERSIEIRTNYMFKSIFHL